MKWSWTIEDGVFAVRPAPLPPGLEDLVFRGRGVHGPGPLPSPEQTVCLEQVHGTDVVWAAEPGVLPHCDAVRSASPGLPLSIRTADCLSVVLVSPAEGVAVVHAGWRGLADGIVESAVQTFQNPARLQVVLGPAIGPCCFEVGSEVAEQFPLSVIPSGPRGKPHVDLPGETRRRLRESGLARDAVVGGDLCTRCNQHVLYSHRGSGGDGNRCITLARFQS